MKQIITLAALLSLSVPAFAGDQAGVQGDAAARIIPVYLLHETSIPFAGRNTIQDFVPMSDRVLFLQGRDSQWYRVRTLAPCVGLDRAIGVGFEINSDGSFDRSSTIRVDGQRCQLDSVTQSERPWTRRDLTKN